ncbi:nucleoside ABC transporter ATP-binding protein [Proteiniborus ethanoligenes]|uniref:Nucleoside ABC transporter ATP-binding protein n=1 Tax=Proteiniborus ethanoligenes TaxID=415015 RepID=A0A1H3RLU5_9FIRM|nr:ABC transporter ATP-binding protein [Proteiniborus ethanoligenes]SDZ26724.1 nucleoside ABC transporter ATP-binding protein [Proteiniborus ethanoligenes]
MDYVVEMKNITKIFPGVVANDNVDFTLKKGETHVLLGENGAGKTTLMNILYGLYLPTSGEIYIHGEKVSIDNPNIAIEKGIGMVHQHFMLVQPFTIAENIILGTEPSKFFGLNLDMKKAIEDVIEISDKYGLAVDPNAKIQDISVGMQQRVEILKALYRGADILILDEPTAVLTPQEIDELGVILDNLKNQGKSIILITHKLKEVMTMSDRVTVIRRGKVIGTLNTQDTNTDELAEFMVGRKVNLVVEKEDKEPGDVILEVKNLEALDNRHLPALKGLSFNVRAGEILAIAGVDGNGQTELVEVLTHLRKAKSGIIELNGKDIAKCSTKEIIDIGVGHIPEDRHKRGLVLNHSLAENMILGNHREEPYSKNGIMDYKKIHEHALELIKEFDVRTPNEEVAAKSLSGGNQQKVIIAREINRDPMLLIASQPTRGLDVGAIEFVHRRIVEQRNRGKAVLLVSLELDEVMALADRIAVIYDGNIVGIVDSKDATERKLGIMMAGGKADD